MDRSDKFLRNVPTHCSDVSHTLVDLRDVPATYSGNEDKFLKTTASGVTFSDVVHGEISGLSSDDHAQYIPVDGSRGFTSTVSGIEPTEGYHLTNRDYVIGISDGTINPPGVSGTSGYSMIQFNYGEDLGVSSTNSTSYQQKLRLTVSGIPDGNYRIGWTGEWRMSKANEDFHFRIQLDDSEDLFSFTQSPYVNVLYWHINSSFFYYNSMSEGEHDIDIDFHSSSIGATAELRNARLEFWRIQ